MSALDRRGGTLGVIRLEFPTGAPDTFARQVGETLRFSDWTEMDDHGVWVLLDHPGTDPDGVAVRLRRRFEDLRGAGIIWQAIPGRIIPREIRLEEAEGLLGRVENDVPGTSVGFRFIND